jgi:hypothetical protein
VSEERCVMRGACELNAMGQKGICVHTLRMSESVADAKKKSYRTKWDHSNLYRVYFIITFVTLRKQHESLIITIIIIM